MEIVAPPETTKLQLLNHQQSALVRAREHFGFALFAETGTGKTPIAISLIKERQVKTLIVCPLSIIESVWCEEIKKWAPDFTPINLWKRHGYDTHEQLRSFKAIGIINYESLSKLRWDYLETIKFLILDESQRIKTPDAAITKFLIGSPSGRGEEGYASHRPYRLILSGTPAPNTPLEYWSQMAVVDRNLLGGNYYAFRSTYFYSCGYGNYQWKIRPSIAQTLMEKIKERAFFISKKECLDLPEQTFQTRTYTMDAKQSEIYEKLKKEHLANYKDTVILGVNEIAKIMKLRQITSGFAINDAGEITEIANGKFNLLLELLEEIGDKQVIIWCQFHYEIKKIQELLGDDCCVLYGDMAQADKELSIKLFAGMNRQYLIAHPRSGGVGLTFTNCAYNIYFSLNYSYESLKQSQDRTHRHGQKRNVSYYFLMANKTIDGVIYRALEKKENISDAMLEMLQNESGNE